MELSKICEYSSKRIDSALLTVENYVSTENMMQNKGGIALATKVPIGNAVEFLPGDILLSNIRPYFRKIWLSDKRGGCSSDVLCIRALPGVDSTYLYYLLSQDSFFDYVMTGAKGCKMPRGDKSQILRWDIDLPNLEEQHRIASILKSIDQKIELNNQINHNLEAQAQALYKSWFVDFEPFKDGKFVESELGMIPEGWNCGLVSDLLSIKYGKDHKKLSDGDIPVYGSGGVMRYVDTKIYEGEAVLIPRKGTLNNVFYVNKAFWTVDTMFYATSKEANSCIYSYLFLTNKDLASMNAGSAVPSMTTDILNNMQIVIPPEEVLERFNNLCFVLFMQMKQYAIENIHLRNQRDILLPKLMSGELKINDLTC